MADKTAAETETVETVEATKPKRNRAAAPNKSVDELLASLTSSAPSAEKSAADQARDERAEQVKSVIAATAQQIAGLTQGAADEESVKAALVSLRTVGSRATKAIGSVPDEALGL